MGMGISISLSVFFSEQTSDSNLISRFPQLNLSQVTAFVMCLLMFLYLWRYVVGVSAYRCALGSVLWMKEIESNAEEIYRR